MGMQSVQETHYSFFLCIHISVTPQKQDLIRIFYFESCKIIFYPTQIIDSPSLSAIMLASLMRCLIPIVAHTPNAHCNTVEIKSSDLHSSNFARDRNDHMEQ